MAMMRDQFDHELAEILNEETGSGNFLRKGYGPGGIECVHHFSLAVGFGSLMWISKYRKRFRVEVPEWTELANPYHVARMCRLAVEHRRRLPKVRPELPSSEKD
jgi:hypothetical protein